MKNNMGKYDLNEGNEALNRVLLMMKYDSKKTLTENKEEVDEQNRGVAGTTATAAGAAAGAGIAAAGLLPGTAGVALPAIVGPTALAAYAGTGAAGAVTSVGFALGASGTGTALALGGAVLGGAAALAVAPLAYWLITKDDGYEKVKRIFHYCSTDRDKINKIPKQLSPTQLRDLSDKLYDAMEGITTDEDAIYSALGELKTASDFCGLVDAFSKYHDGELLEWLDDDIDDQSEWNRILRPIRNVVEDTLLSIKDEAAGKKIVEKIKTGKTSSYKSCSGTYTKGCKSPVIAQVQGCVGITPDGKFGPKTDAALKAKGFNIGFTDNDVKRLCKPNVVVTDNEPNVPSTPEVGTDAVSLGDMSNDINTLN